MDELQLDLRTVGRPRRQLAAAVVRELRAEDLLLLNEPRASSAVPTIKKIRSRHHALARALAAGMTDGEASMITRYDPSRISILKQDPSFQELLRFYEADTRAAYIDMHEMLAGLSSDALEELRTRLEEDPDSLSNSLLLEIAKVAADRSGFGPTTTSLNLNVNLAARLEAARKRVKDARADAE